MPLPLRIPERHLPGLLAIARLTDEGASQLRAALEVVPPHLTKDRLAAQIAAGAPELADDAADSVRSVLSLIGLIPDDLPGLSADLAREVAESPDLDLDDLGRAVFAERLSELLNLDALVLSARALDVVTEYDQVFHDARVLTDIRPVFGSDVSKGPAAAAVAATLKVDFHRADRETTSAYFAMDHMDLILLRGVLDRALTKIASLRGLIDSMEIPYWEYEEPNDASGT